MSVASNLSKSVASASPTLVHFNQEFGQHLHGSHQASLMDISQNSRNFGSLQSQQELENNIQDLNREARLGWTTPMQDSRRSQQQQPGQQQPWLHYGPPTLSPIQASPVRCYPENEEIDAKGQKRAWSEVNHHLKTEERDRKRTKTNYPVMDSKEFEREYRKILTAPVAFQQMGGQGGEMLGYFLSSSSDPSKVSSKDIQQKMNKKDGEINMVEQTIVNLKSKCNELREVKMMSEKDNVAEVTIEVSESRPQTIARLIYGQNKLKAHQSHHSLVSLGAVTSLPLYNQPSDTLVYRDNKKRFQAFKKLLMAHLAKKQQAEKIRIRYLSERYAQLYTEWIKKLNKRENNACRKEKDAKFREFFEKVFPDLKKQKEDKDKLQRISLPGNRPAGYARSDAGMEEIVNEIHEQEVKEKRMSSLSVTPPMILDSRQRSSRIVDETRLIRSFDFRQKLWTTAESEIFAEKYQQFPKKFGIIASFLENKTVQDCVLFYYLTKKAANYKQMTRRFQAMRKRDKKFRTAQNVQNQDNKLGDNSSTLESSIAPGPGFSYMSTILLPNSSFASSFGSNIVSSSNVASSTPTTTPTPVNSAPLEQFDKIIEPKKEPETTEVSRHGKPSDPTCEDRCPDVTRRMSGSEEIKDSNNVEGNSTVEVIVSDDKMESSLTQVLHNPDPDVSENVSNENCTGAKTPNSITSEDKITSKESPQPKLQSEASPSSSSSPPTTTTITIEPEVPIHEEKNANAFSFPGVGVEDISDKEDNDSVATLSADEGPTMTSEDNKDLSQSALKRPRLLDDGYKDGIDKKKHSEEIVLNWDTKSKRHSNEENTQFYAIPIPERERRSMPPSELQDRQLEVSYHESTDTDLVYNLVRKNRSPARIKDLIHAAIEKNLQNSGPRMDGDTNGCTSPLGSWPSRGETPINRMSSPQIHSTILHPMQQHFSFQKQHNHPMEPPIDYPANRHPALRSPSTNDLAQQHLAMKMMSHDRPNSYSPFQPVLMNPHDVNPPPAHSHHHQQGKITPSSRGPPAQYLENNRLYELAAIAAERGRLDEKEKRAHKENMTREVPYPGNIPLSLLRLPCDPMMNLHKGLSQRGNSGTMPSTPQHGNVHVGTGRGSITKGTSGRSEAMQQQGSVADRQVPHDWPGPPRTTLAYPMGGVPSHPTAVDYLSPAQVLRGDFLTAHQMGQTHLSQQNQLYLQQQLQHYQGLATRQGEKKHHPSPAPTGHEIPHNKNHSNQEPVKRKARVIPETKNPYQDHVDYPHKKAQTLEDVHKQMPVELRAHSRNQQIANYYFGPQDPQHYMNDGQRPKPSQQPIGTVADKSLEQQKVTKKEFQPTNQMTAANLIEAIIYLQINRNEADENALKMSGSLALSNSGLLPHLSAREEGTPHDRNSKVQSNPQHVAPISSKLIYEKSQKFSQVQPHVGEYSVRSAPTESRAVPDRIGLIKDGETPHHQTSKHIKELNNPTKKFAPYDHLSQPQTQRHDVQASNPQTNLGGRKFITASDRIEAIIAQDIGNQDDLPAHNEDVQSAIKEYMRIPDARLNKFDSLDASLLSRFPYALARPYDLDKSAYIPFYSPGMLGGLVPLRMPIGQLVPEDKPITSQSILTPKVWQHGVQPGRSERNVMESRAAAKQMNEMDTKQNVIHLSSKDLRSENDGMPTLRCSPSQQFQFQQPTKMTAADFRNPVHSMPDLSSQPIGMNLSEKISQKELNCSDNSVMSSASNISPPAFSHLNWKAKMLRQHKEQKIAENSHPMPEISNQSSKKNYKDELGRKQEDVSSQEDNKSEAGLELKDTALMSVTSSSISPPTNGGQPSPSTKTHNLLGNTTEERNDPNSLLTSSSYWSPRSTTEKCSSNSSDGLRIDLPVEEEEDDDDDDDDNDDKTSEEKHV